MSLKAQTHFNTIRNIWVISPHLLLPPQCLACLRVRTALQMRLQHCPPSPSSHPRPYHPYACVVPSQHASDTAYHPYTRGVPSRHCLPALRSRSALLTCSRHH
ncbi:hypothetical protein O181_103748 [Austropuccinia psidii MF-1]|uniref:Uncharacterized protein n=1 Tax=Austropuccinia psidii MF-1 TaxID=1389203 RepID=A0A9Q3PJC1_9BASI|nr:hypothetical protein [Austropuccinia psidii MF-1]